MCCPVCPSMLHLNGQAVSDRGLWIAPKSRNRDRACHVSRTKLQPATFDFLGFTHICARSQVGRFWVRRSTIAIRMRAKLEEVKDQLKRRRHDPIPVQGQWLATVLQGHMAYYAVPGNSDAVTAFRHQVTLHWHWALRRRSQRGRVNWVSAARSKGPPQSRFCQEHGTTCLPLMGPSGLVVCQLWDRPAWLRGFRSLGRSYWRNELPGGFGDRDQGDAPAVAGGSRSAGGGPVVGHRSQDRAPVCGEGAIVRGGP